MEVIARFEYFGKNYEFKRNISDFDRNDAKEPYAYFNERIDDEIWIGTKTRFEITLIKNSRGELVGDGAYAMAYMVDIDGKETPCHYINEVEVEFKHGIEDEIEYLKGKMSDTVAVAERTRLVRGLD